MRQHNLLKPTDFMPPAVASGGQDGSTHKKSFARSTKLMASGRSESDHSPSWTRTSNPGAPGLTATTTGLLQ